jgi:hypothetical protein
MKRALVKSIRPNLPHLSDIADDATGDRIHSDPNSLFNAFLTDDGTGVLDC